MRIAVTFLSTKDYFRGTAVAVSSFIKNNKWFAGDIIIYTADDLTHEEETLLTSLYKFVIIKKIDISTYDCLKEKKSKFTFYESEEYFNSLISNSFYKFEAFTETDYDKVMFIDSDIVIIGSVHTLFCNDADLIFSIDTEARRFDFDIKPRNNEYINSGIFVVGKRYLSHLTKEKLLSFYIDTDFSVISDMNPYAGRYCDQDVFSMYFANSMCICSNKFNCKFFFYDGNAETTAIHFIGENKPWLNGRRVNDEIWYDAETQMMDSVYMMQNKSEITYFPKKDNSDKYIVCACIRNEDEYIEEWVKHYLNIGFDKILLFDNNDKFGIVEEKLGVYAAYGEVEIFNCSGMSHFQVPMYDMLARSHNFKWMACFDADEFLELSPKYNNVKDFLDECEGDCVLVNWLMYGPDKQLSKKKGTVQERFVNPVYPICLFKENMFFKPIVKNNEKNFHLESSHTPVYDGGTLYNIGGYYLTDEKLFQVSYPVRYKKVWLKHYYTKSFEEYMNKMQRGWPDDNNVERLNNYSHYLLMDSSDDVNELKFTENIFSQKEHPEILDNLYEYDVVAFLNPEKNYYALLHYLSVGMTMVKDHTFIVEEDIDENIYLMLFEMALKTGNKLIASNDVDYAYWYIYLKHTKKEDKFNNTYYVITVR